MRKFVIMGIQGSGKGTQAKLLADDLDLEADLSIDSIKRTEILGELAERLGLTVSGVGLDERTLTELSARKTLQAIVTWVTARTATLRTATAAAASRRPNLQMMGLCHDFPSKALVSTAPMGSS